MLADGDYTLPAIRQFDARSEQPSLSHLAAEVARAPARLYGMEPKRFEVFVGSILREFYGCDVYHVGQTADDGIDLLAVVKDDPLMIQVKRRASERAAESVNTVKLLFASAFGQQSSRGMVVTTAERFTRAATKWAASPPLVDRGFDLQLVDFSSLMSMVNCVAEADGVPPWQRHQHRRPPSESPASDWAHEPHQSHDIVTLCGGSRMLAVHVSHHHLTNCLVLSGDAPVVREFLTRCRGVNGPASIPTLVESLSNQGELRCVERRFDIELAHELDVPWQIQGRVASRLISLYPETVLDHTW